MKARETKKNESTPPRGITVDWIVVTASFIGTAVVIAAAVKSGENSLISQVASVF